MMHVECSSEPAVMAAMLLNKAGLLLQEAEVSDSVQTGPIHIDLTADAAAPASDPGSNSAADASIQGRALKEELATADVEPVPKRRKTARELAEAQAAMALISATARLPSQAS